MLFVSNKCSFHNILWFSFIYYPNVHKPVWQIKHLPKRMTSYRHIHCMYKLWTLFSNSIQRWKSLVWILLLLQNQFIFISPTTINATQKREDWLTTFVWNSKSTMKLSSSITLFCYLNVPFPHCIKIKFQWLVFFHNQWVFQRKSNEKANMNGVSFKSFKYNSNSLTFFSKGVKMKEFFPFTKYAIYIYLICP